MGTPSADEELLEAVRLVRSYGSKKAAAEAAGIPRATIQRRYKKAEEKGLIPDENPERPDFGPDDIPIEDVISHLKARVNAAKKHRDKQTWFPIKFKSNEPILLCVVGDPHLGTHTHWEELERDIELMQTPGCHAINLGDTVNNWGWGYLLKKYADEDISRKTERELARWFLEQVPWLIWLEGNHDTMAGEFEVFLREIGGKKITMIDWRALFRLVFPNKTEIFCDFAHNHKGVSQYNPLHGQKKASLWTPGADIFCAGHHHNFAMHMEEDDVGRLIHFGRARGYKILDEYAHRWQFSEGTHGRTISYFIDPMAEDPTKRIIGFANLELGVQYLTLRREHG
jgi:hypothetical protein